MPDQELVAAEDLLHGVEFIGALAPGWTPLGAAVMIKCLDEQGNASWAMRYGADINEEELIGALTVQLKLLTQHTVQKYL